MVVFGRKKKKSEPKPDSFDRATSQDATPRSISFGPASFSFRGNGFYKALTSSSKSFRSLKKGVGDGLISPTTPNTPGEFRDVTPGSTRNFGPEEPEGSNDVTHHSVNGRPSMSPTMAAIHARTMENIARQERDSKSEQSSHMSGASGASGASGDAAYVLRQTGKQESLRGRLERHRTPRSKNMMPSKSSSSQEGLSEHWMIDMKDVVLSKTIGHSSFGTVNEGRFNGTKVAVKTIHYGSNANSQDALSSFRKEAELNCKLRHPNIVLFMGIAVQPTKICIVTELMSRGNVRDLLVSKVKGRILRLDWSLRQQWALDTAQGMAYLHSLRPPMIHRDLKTTNLLVDKGMNVKICDFGLSRFKTDQLMTAVGTVHFAAPEVLNHERYTEKADLFSFGTVMWELYTRECVFKGLPQIEVYSQVVSGNMPDVDKNCDARYRALMKDCWATDPTKRPCFREVIDRLAVLVDELDSDSGG
ncbi:Serine/threonine protein kinase [Gracilaria domingensis]|nr:Serine/threonine protein kinase [Gracilaria domingensis]